MYSYFLHVIVIIVTNTYQWFISTLVKTHCLVWVTIDVDKWSRLQLRGRLVILSLLDRIMTMKQLLQPMQPWNIKTPPVTCAGTKLVRALIIYSNQKTSYANILVCSNLSYYRLYYLEETFHIWLCLVGVDQNTTEWEYHGQLTTYVIAWWTCVCVCVCVCVHVWVVCRASMYHCPRSQST